MKKLFFIAIIALFASCNSTPKDVSQIDLSNFKQKISYALGADFGTNFKNVPKAIFSQFNKSAIEHGFESFLQKEQSFDQCNEVLSSALGSPSGIDTSKYSIDSISFCYGALFGNSLRSSLTAKKAFDRINMDIIGIGFKQSLLGVDTLIDLGERKKMIIDFNNDLNKLVGMNYLDSIKKTYPNDIKKDGFILVEEEKGNGDPINLEYEYRIILTIENVSQDTIISTFKVGATTDKQNSEIINSDSPILPEIWEKAAQYMVVGGKYTIYTPYNLGYGEKGLQNPAPPNNYVIQPYQALVIHAKVLSQDVRYTAVKKAGNDIISEAKKKPNTYIDPSGFILTTKREGDGEKVKKGADVQANYILTNAEGQVIENSYIRSQQTQQPAPIFSLNNVVKGWKLALPKMKVGGHYLLVLPYDLAYGEMGNGNIGPYETLTFDISILQTGPAGSLLPQRNPTQLPQFSEEDMQKLQKQLKESQSK